MKRLSFFIFIIFILHANSCLSNDATSSYAPPTTLHTLRLSSTDDWHQYVQLGFRISSDILISSKKLSSTDRIKSFFSGSFGFYARGGYKFIFGELGLQYSFHKGNYEIIDGLQQVLSPERVETRYLQIPLKVVGRFPLGKIFALMPNAGIIYSPLIHVSKNDIDYTKKVITQHQFIVTAGLEASIKFITIGVDYRYCLKPFFSDRTSQKTSFVNISLGIQF